MKAVSLAGKLETAVLAGGPVAQAGKGFKTITGDAGGREALTQTGHRLEAVLLDTKGLQAVGEAAECLGVAAVHPTARQPATEAQRGLQAVLAHSGRPRAPAAAAAGTLQAVTLDTGRITRAAEAREGLEAVGREGAGAETGTAAGAVAAEAVGRGCGRRLGIAARGRTILAWGLYSPHQLHSPPFVLRQASAPAEGRAEGATATPPDPTHPTTKPPLPPQRPGRRTRVRGQRMRGTAPPAHPPPSACAPT